MPIMHACYNGCNVHNAHHAHNASNNAIINVWCLVCGGMVRY